MRDKSEMLVMLTSALMLVSAFAVYGYPGSATQQMDADARFMEQIADISLSEVTAGRIAAKKARSVDVREFSEMMVSEYAWTTLDLRALARTKGVNIDETLDQQHRARIARLASLDGAAFDRAYVQSLVVNYSEAISLCEAAAVNTADREVQVLARHVLPILRQHLDTARELALAQQPPRAAAKPAPSATAEKKRPLPRGTRSV